MPDETDKTADVCMVGHVHENTLCRCWCPCLLCEDWRKANRVQKRTEPDEQTGERSEVKPSSRAWPSLTVQATRVDKPLEGDRAVLALYLHLHDIGTLDTHMGIVHATAFERWLLDGKRGRRVLLGGEHLPC